MILKHTIYFIKFIFSYLIFIFVYIEKYDYLDYYKKVMEFRKDLFIKIIDKFYFCELIKNNLFSLSLIWNLKFTKIYLLF
jgi:hypothetical protein